MKVETLSISCVIFPSSVSEAPLSSLAAIRTVKLDTRVEDVKVRFRLHVPEPTARLPGCVELSKCPERFCYDQLEGVHKKV